MINASMLKEIITFQVHDDVSGWQNLLTTHAYMNGIKGVEQWIELMGGNADEFVYITVRYNHKLMNIIPQRTQVLHNGNKYDIISPPDDVNFLHKEIKFKGRRQII